MAGTAPDPRPVAAHLSPRLSLDRIRAAERQIDPVFLGSPQFVCEPLSDDLSVELSLKIELLNPIRSFKGRGAEWLASQAVGEQRLVCASAGNFGQALAYACRKRSRPLTVYAARSANPLKVDRMRRLGATVIQDGDDYDAAKDVARRVAEEQGWRLIEDGADVETVEGAGTIALEWLRAPAPPAVWLVPLGNGGLINGIGHVVKSLQPDIRLIAVQAAGAPAMLESWRAGRVISHPRISTIADGIGVRVPIPVALDDLRGILDDGLTVDETSIKTAMRLVHRRIGVVIEPSAAVGVAALLAYPDRFRGQRVGTILCGGNLTEQQMHDWLGPA